MRVFAILLSLALLSACASSRPAPAGVEFVTRIGVITAKGGVSTKDGEGSGDSASKSSDSGQLTGFGMLMSAGFGVSSESTPVRYQVKLQGGEKITVYHDSAGFEVGDCVEISSLAGDEENPPLMKRIDGGC
jgi:hypothetical protein